MNKNLYIQTACNDNLFSTHVS